MKISIKPLTYMHMYFLKNVLKIILSDMYAKHLVTI